MEKRDNLTAQSVDRAKPPVGRPWVLVRDGKVEHLALRITAQDTKSFVFEARIGGAKYQRAIGTWPTMSLDAARARTSELNALIEAGRDPFEEERLGTEAERQAAAAEKTFADLEAEYIRCHLPKKAAHSALNDRCNLTNHIPAKWRARALKDFTSEDVRLLHHTIREGGVHLVNGRERRTGGPYSANRVVALLRKMFNLARKWGYLKGQNPAAEIELFREERRERFYSADEISRLSAALEQEVPPFRSYFALTLMTGTRKGEWLGAKWSDVDLTARSLLIRRTKGNKPLAIPLFDAALAVVESLDSRDSSEWLFPALRGGEGHMAGVQAVWKRVRERAGIMDGGACIHALRHSLASWLIQGGASTATVQRALNHSSIAVTQRYLHHDHTALSAVLEANAARMPSLAGPVAAVQPAPPATGELDA